MKRVLVVAASSVVRAGLEALVRASPALALVGSAANAGFARQVDDLRPDAAPDVILIELDSRNEVAVNELLTLASGARQAPAIVALVDEAQGAWAVEALRTGVRALLTGEASAEEIQAAVEAAAAGLVVLDSRVAEALTGTAAFVPRGAPDLQPEALTPREIEVLVMIAEGFGNKTIAQRLGISEHTVKFHVSSIFAKLGVTSRTEAVKIGIRRGLIML
ncbi:MAG TPA: response regulator transcription factor [Blastocatellia bacterium]|nr:response regulator transcription factor [Blastocatellia bacterium]